MNAGLHHLRLTPDVFWRLTPAELSVMLGLGWKSRPLNRDRLNDLLRIYPDAPREKDGQNG